MDYARRLLIDALAAAEAELQGYAAVLSNMLVTSPSYQIVQIRHRTKTAEVADLTQALAALEPKDTDPTDYGTYRFKRGDYIEITDGPDVVRGTALDDRQHFGWAGFYLLEEGKDTVRSYNLNSVTVKLLHSADIARGVDVPTGEC